MSGRHSCDKFIISTVVTLSCDKFIISTVVYDYSQLNRTGTEGRSLFPEAGDSVPADGRNNLILSIIYIL
jgi:hypothetical protein